jgi:glucan phosphorylase
LTEHLVQGVDIWLNTPRRPWEASGTSGMKVLVNGGINLSELDGWWAEALYRLFEHEVIPEFYTGDEQGIPRAWVNRMREGMAIASACEPCTPQQAIEACARQRTDAVKADLYKGCSRNRSRGLRR